MNAGDPVLIGLDIGTTNIKATAFSPAGELLALASTPTVTHSDGPSRAHYLADELWQLASGVLRDVVGQLPNPAAIAGIAVTSMGESGVLLDAQGKALCEVITWFDRRSLPQMDELAAKLGDERIAAISGLNPQPIYSLLKLSWLKANRPEAMGRAKRWLHMADFMAYKLCGVPATDWSVASRTMAFDVTNRVWSDELLEAAGISPALLAPALPSGVALGPLTAQAAAETGLPAHCIVSTGGQDHVCGAFAAGATTRGAMLDSLGTAEALFMALDRPPDPQYALDGYAIGAHVAPGMTYLCGSVFASGGAMNWLRGVVGRDTPVSELMEEAARIPAGSNGAMFLPHLWLGDPPHPDNRSRGVLLGLGGGHDRGTITRAVLEGMAFEARAGFEPMLAAVNRDTYPPIALIGGGARNRLLVEIKAWVLNTPLHVLEISEGTALGAAMLAGIGAGVYDDASDALRRVKPHATIIEPDPAQAERYDRLYHDAFLQLYDATKALNHTLLSIASSDGVVS